MAAESAGILLYKRQGRGLLVLLVHPGGPFWRNKDDGAWTIPKGERSAGEDAETTARREFAEELGATPTACVDPARTHSPARRQAGRRLRPRGRSRCRARSSSNSFEIEWPPRSGRRQSFPEVDRAAWFSPDEARQKINAGSEAIHRSPRRTLRQAMKKAPLRAAFPRAIERSLSSVRWAGRASGSRAPAAGCCWRSASSRASGCRAW